MRKKVLFTIVAIIVVLLMLLLLNVFSSKEQKRFNWFDQYKGGKEPYDTYVIAKLLSKYNNEHDFKKIIDQPVHQVLDNKEQSANYILIGQDAYYSEADIQKLLQFVSDGNQAFIATKLLPENLLDAMGEMLNSKIRNQYVDTSIVNLNFYHDNLTHNKGYYFNYIVKNKEEKYSWAYFQLVDSVTSYINITKTEDSSYNMQPISITALGFFDDQKNNFIKIPYGKGSFYFHSNPLTFTNYHLLNRKRVEYAEKVFSYLSDGNIYYDEFSKIPISNSHKKQNNASQGPFAYILSQKSLRWAWYLLLITIFIYLIFYTKRKQRIIPVTDPNINTSIEFTETIGRLYYQKRDHRKIAIIKMNAFLMFLRNHYHISTQNLDERFREKLHLKSQIKKELIEQILDTYNTFINTEESLSQKRLIEFYQNIEHFYRHCK